MHAFNALTHPSRRSKNLLRALALASLAIAGIVLPLVWNILAAINELPKMAWLQQLLAISPIASWLMMFAWGAAIPIMLLLCMHETHRARHTLGVLALMFIAITWYVHMPASGQCGAMYPHAGWACTILDWGYSLSLGFATAAYVFTVLGMGISALGLFAENLSEHPMEHAS